MVAYEILVSPQGPLVLGFWVWRLRGQGLTIIYLLTVYIFYYFSAVFAGVVNVNSTASNATVPSGLWAIPSLGDLPLIGNGSFPTGRKRRSVMDNIVEESGDYFEMAEDLGEILGPSLSDHQSGDNIRDKVRSALTSALLMDSSDECQAAFGCGSL